MNILNFNDGTVPSINKTWLFNLSVIAIAFSMNTNARAAPITFNTALPVSEGQTLVRALLVHDNKSTPAVDIEQSTLVSVLGYGVNSKLSVFGVLPSSEVKRDINNVENRESALGDAELFGRYEVLRIDELGITKRITPFAGVRFATGELGVTSDGTTDVFAGVSFTSASTKQNIEAQIRYDLNGSDNIDSLLNTQQRFNQGDQLSADVSWQKRVLPKKISNDTKGFWFAVLEANATFTQNNRLNGISDENTGGFITSLSPGLQYSTRRWIGELAVRIPIIKNVNGNGLEPDYSVFAGLRAKF